MQQGLRFLNEISLAGVPGRLRGLLAFVLRTGLWLIRDAPGDVRAQKTAGWKLFMLAPQMLLSRPPGRPPGLGEPGFPDQLCGVGAGSLAPEAQGWLC